MCLPCSKASTRLDRVMDTLSTSYDTLHRLAGVRGLPSIRGPSPYPTARAVSSLLQVASILYELVITVACGPRSVHVLADFFAPSLSFHTSSRCALLYILPLRPQRVNLSARHGLGPPLIPCQGCQEKVSSHEVLLHTNESTGDRQDRKSVV